MSGAGRPRLPPPASSSSRPRSLRRTAHQSCRPSASVSNVTAPAPPSQTPEIETSRRIEMAFRIAPAFVEHDQRAGPSPGAPKQAAPMHRAAQRRTAASRRKSGRELAENAAARARPRSGRHHRATRRKQIRPARTVRAIPRCASRRSRPRRGTAAAPKSCGRRAGRAACGAALDQQGQRAAAKAWLCIGQRAWAGAPFLRPASRCAPARKIVAAPNAAAPLRVSVCALEDMHAAQQIPAPLACANSSERLI